MGAGEGAAACRSCATPLAGDFCWRCGQRDLPPNPTLRELLGEAWGEFVSVDGKVLASVRQLVTRPGGLTAEFLAGRRAPYLPPIRLYLICSLLFFLLVPHLPKRAPTAAARERAMRDSIANAPARARAVRDSIARETARDSLRRAALRKSGRPVPTGPLDSATFAIADSLRLEQLVSAKVHGDPHARSTRATRALVIATDRMQNRQNRLWPTVFEQLPRLMFVIMPLFGAMLAIAYRGRRLRLPVHLVMSLHLHAIGFIAVSAAAVGAVIPQVWLRRPIVFGLLGWFIVYVMLAFQRVYGGRRWLAGLRAIVLLTTYFFVALSTLLMLVIPYLSFS